MRAFSERLGPRSVQRRSKKEFSMKKHLITYALPLLVTALVVPCITATATTYTVAPSGADFSSIQAAVNVSSNGDKIVVWDGTYNENVDVTKQLNIHSLNGPITTVVIATNPSDHVFDCSVEHVSIAGFTIYGATNGLASGIYLRSYGCASNNVSGYDDVHNNNYGIFVDGDDCTVVSNECMANGGYGIYLDYNSDRNIVVGNTCTANKYNGIDLYDRCDYNTVASNTCNLNGTRGIGLGHLCQHNLVLGNSCHTNEYSGIYVDGADWNRIEANACNGNRTTGDGIDIRYADNTMVCSNYCVGNLQGLDLYQSQNCTITGNSCSSNLYHGAQVQFVYQSTLSRNLFTLNGSDGLYMGYCSNNKVVGNTCSVNSGYGLYLRSSGYYFFLNNFISNVAGNVESEAETGLPDNWRTPTVMNYKYSAGSIHKGDLGNYYSDHTLTDSDGDGVTDSDYDLPPVGAIDENPLVAMADQYSLLAWWIKNDSTMLWDCMDSAPGTELVTSNTTNVWVAGQAATSTLYYTHLDAWPGQIVFNEPPVSGRVFKVKIGTSDNGANFTASGPEAVVTANGISRLFSFATSTSGFLVEQGSYLAVRLSTTNEGYHVLLSGGASSYVSIIPNFAPVLTSVSPAIGAISEDETNNSGTTAASLLGNAVADENINAVEGIALFATVSGNGTWQYSTNAVAAWHNVGSVSVTQALLLRASDKLRFVPDGQNADNASLGYYAWDQTIGSVESKTDASFRGGSTALSTAHDTASIVVSAVNDTPFVSLPIASQYAIETASFNYTFPSNTFQDVDVGDSFDYASRQASGSPLPSWLDFTAGTRTFSGTPGIGDAGTVEVHVIGSDTNGAAATNQYSLTIDQHLHVAGVFVSNNIIMIECAGGNSFTQYVDFTESLFKPWDCILTNYFPGIITNLIELDVSTNAQQFFRLRINTE